MLTQSQIDAFDHDGFLNGGRVLDDKELDELTKDLDRIIATGPTGFKPGEPKPVLFRDLTNISADNPYGTGGSTPVWQIVNIWEASEPFERLLYNPKVVKAITQLTKMNELMIWHDQLQYKPKEAGGATTWHQDAPLWPTIMPMTPVSAWIPFDDADLDNGCMWMVPGSHKWGNNIQYLGQSAGNLKTLDNFNQVGKDFKVPEGAEVKKVEAVPRPVKRGEVSFHHSLTWHGSPVNKSPRPRRAIAIHYMTGEAIYQGKRGHPMEQFISLQAGAPMSQAGPHFPIVCTNGEPVRWSGRRMRASA
jgi:hypothetical protein